MKGKELRKRILSLVLAAGMIIGSIPVTGVQDVQASANFQADEGLLAHYPLESNAEDVSGNDKDAVITSGATGVTFEDNALKLAGGSSSSANYVT